MKLTTGQAAARLGVTERRIRSMIKAGRLRATKAGRDWRINEAELMKVQGRKPGRPRKNGQAYNAAVLADDPALYLKLDDQPARTISPPGRKRKGVK